MQRAPSVVLSGRPAAPADPELASKEKQRRRGEARAGLLAAKNGETSPPTSSTGASTHREAEAADRAVEDSAPAGALALKRDEAGVPSQCTGAPRPQWRNAIVAEIADALGESNGHTRHSLHTLLRHHGKTFLREHLAKAREVEASGGMLTLDGSRRRTLCGIFFFLAKQTIGAEAWRALFPFMKKPRRKNGRDDRLRGERDAPVLQHGAVLQHGGEGLEPFDRSQSGV